MTNLRIPIVNIAEPLQTSLDSGLKINRASSDFIPSMNIEPVLHEIRHGLSALHHQENKTVIDLSSMPFAPGEKEQLQSLLGVGEIEIKLNAMGTSYLHETNYPGVWWIDHYSTDKKLTGSYIEIAPVPDIIQADNQDISDGLQRLTQTLQQKRESNENYQ